MPPSVQGRHGRVDIRAKPPGDGALRVDAVQADPDRLELAALGGAADRLRMNSEQLGELAGLVVLFDHRRSIELEGKTVTIENSQNEVPYQKC